MYVCMYVRGQVYDEIDDDDDDAAVGGERKVTTTTEKENGAGEGKLGEERAAGADRYVCR